MAEIDMNINYGEHHIINLLWKTLWLQWSRLGKSEQLRITHMSPSFNKSFSYLLVVLEILPPSYLSCPLGQPYQSWILISIIPKSYLTIFHPASDWWQWFEWEKVKMAASEWSSIDTHQTPYFSVYLVLKVFLWRGGVGRERLFDNQLTLLCRILHLRQRTSIKE